VAFVFTGYLKKLLIKMARAVKNGNFIVRNINVLAVNA